MADKKYPNNYEKNRLDKLDDLLAWDKITIEAKGRRVYISDGNTVLGLGETLRKAIDSIGVTSDELFDNQTNREE